MDNIEYTGHNTETNKIKSKSETIMNGQHWVHKTQHGNKQNKNKTPKTNSAIMNGQHWVHKTQHGDKQNFVFGFLFFFCLFPCCVLCTQCCPFMIVSDFDFILFVSVLCPVYSMLSIHDCYRFCYLCFVFILFVSVLCLAYIMLLMSLIDHSWLLPI
jgi:hypothetical protein